MAPVRETMLGVDGVDREQRRDVLVRVGVRVRVAGVAVRNQRAGQNRRVRRHEMAEPVRPGAVVGDPAEAGDQSPPPLDVAAARSWPRLRG